MSLDVNILSTLLPKPFYRFANQSSKMEEFRSAALKNFHKMGLPTRKTERWKYTPVKPLNLEKFLLSDTPGVVDEEFLDQFLAHSAANLVFIDGCFSADLSITSNKSEGLTIHNLAKQSQQENYLTKSDLDGDPFTFLNSGLMHDGAVISLAKNCGISKPIVIVNVIFSADTASSLRHKITVNENAHAAIIECNIFPENISGFSNSVTEINLAQNAKLDYCCYNDGSENSIHIGSTFVNQGENSSLNSFSFSGNGKLNRQNIQVDLNEEQCSAGINGMYFTSGADVADHHTTINHNVANCQSRQLYKGILKDKSHAVFNGRVYVAPDAQKSDSIQLNKNLLLSKKCRIDTKPELEIYADDVSCTHGATIGQLNQEEIYYCQSRGISAEIAKQMLTNAFALDVLDSIENEEIRNFIEKKLNQKIAESAK